MADTNLTMTATVVDAFSRPLAKLRQDLEATSKTRALPDMQKSWQALRGEVGAFSREIQSQALPSMAAMGLRGAAIGTVLTTAAVAMRGFSSDVKEASMLSRDFGLKSTDSLLQMQNLGRRVGVSFEETQQALGRLSQTTAQAQNRWGALYNELRKTPGGAQLAEQLHNAKSVEEAWFIAIKHIRDNISDPVRQREMAEMVFGNPNMARVARESSDAVIAEVKRGTAQISEKTKEAADKFELQMNRLSEAAQKLKIQALGPLLESANQLWERFEKPIGEAFSAFSRDMVEALPKMNEGFGQLKTVWEGLASVDLSKNIEAVKQLEKLTELPGVGKMVQAFREGGSTETGIGPLANKALEAAKEFLGVKPAEGAAVKQPEGTAARAPDVGVKTPDSHPYLAPGSPQTGGRTNDLVKAQEKLTSATERLYEAWKEGTAAAYGGLASGGGMAPGQSAASSVWGAVKSYFGGGGGGGGGGGAGAGGVGTGPPGGRGSPGGVGRGTAARTPGTSKEVYDYIREKAKKVGIDPDTAVAVANSEGLKGFDPSKPDKGGDSGTSFGPYQLHYAGGTGANQRPGMGDDFTRETGLNARDSKTWKQQVDYALEHAAKGGWGPWNGSKAIGLDRWAGIGGRTGFREGAGAAAGVQTAPLPGMPLSELSVSDRFGAPRPGRRHMGTDYRGAPGTSVYATGAGRVTDINRFGDVTVTHADGSKSVYRHVRPGVKVGQEVASGAEIAQIGPRDTRSTGPHLHYERISPTGQKYDAQGEVEKAHKPGAALKESTNYQAKETAKATAKENPPGKLTAEGLVQITLSDSLAEKNASVKTSGMFKEANIKRERPRVA